MLYYSFIHGTAVTYQELNKQPPLTTHLLAYQAEVHQQEAQAMAVQHFYQNPLSLHYSSTCASDEDVDGDDDARGDDGVSSS
ncbi:hypothetical protein ACHAPA_004842 [Fusarium lateritium]